MRKYMRPFVLLAVFAMVAAACGEDAEPTTTAPPATTATTEPPATTATTEPPATTATTEPPATTATTEAPIDLSHLTTPPDEPRGGEIRFAKSPSFDDALWPFAIEIGMDKRIGIELVAVPFPATTPYVPLATGDIDLLASCQPCYGAQVENFPTYRNYLITNEYQGFSLTGRVGESLSFEEALANNPGDREAAIAELAETLKGKTIAKAEGFPTSQEENLAANIGLTCCNEGDDMSLQFFPTLEAMDFGFLRGEADLYIGILNTQMRLLFSDELAGEYHVVAPLELFGRAVLYSTEGVTQKWLDENPETALRSLAIWYRVSRYLAEFPDIVGDFVSEYQKAATGGVSLGGNVIGAALTELNYFPLLDEAEEYMFTADSKTYYGNIADNFESGIAGGTIPEGTVWSDHEVELEWFNMLMAREDLVAWINAPLGTGVGLDGDVPLS